MKEPEEPQGASPWVWVALVALVLLMGWALVEANSRPSVSELLETVQSTNTQVFENAAIWWGNPEGPVLMIGEERYPAPAGVDGFDQDAVAWVLADGTLQRLPEEVARRFRGDP